MSKKKDAEVNGERAPVSLVLMPFLGGSHHEWDEVIGLLSPEFHCVGLDLPGFGDAANVAGYTVHEMAEYVARQVRELRLERFVLVGHSMAGKVSMVVASLAAKGEPEGLELAGLLGLVLVASSPLSPEPMSEARRQKMIADLGTRGPEFRRHAEEFIAANLDGELPPELFDRAVTDVLRMNCDAWTAWLENGSREHWTKRVGVLAVPALVVAGGADKDLGQDAQRKLVLPQFAVAEFAVVSGAAHLVPMERPSGLAELIAAFVRSLDDSERVTAYMDFIASSRVSEATRKVLSKRANQDGVQAEPQTFTVRELDALRALAACVLPQQGAGIDLAARLAAQLASGEGKGWRYDELPAPVPAYRGALAALEADAQKKHERPFDELTIEEQTSLLTLVAEGKLAGEPSETASLMESVPALTATQMQRWFEDCRGDLTEIYMAHPQTLARIGYSGIGDGADAEALSGFVQLGVGAIEAWEPKGREERS